MSILNKINELESNDIIEKNDILKSQFLLILEKKEELETYYFVIYNIVDKIRQEYNLDKKTYDFHISFDYKDSATPEFRLNYNNLFYNLINKNFSYSFYELGNYDYFLTFTEFMKNIDKKISCFFENICKVASELCKLFHSFSKDLFKIENEYLLDRYNVVISHFKKIRLKKANLDSFIAEYKNKTNIIKFKVVKNYDKISNIYLYDAEFISNNISKIINSNNENEIKSLKEELIGYLSKYIVLYYEEDFSKSTGFKINVIDKNDKFLYNEAYEYLKLVQNIQQF